MRSRLAFLLLLVPAVAAQPRLQRSPVVVGSEAEDPTYGFAVRLLSNGRVEEATALFEDLYAQDPQSDAVWLKLTEAYTMGRRFDDLVDLVNARIARDGATLSLLLDRGTALQRAGRTDEAAVAWSDAVGTAPDDAQTYRIVATTMGSLRLFSEAADLLDAGRQRLGDETLFRLDRAHLYSLALDYEPSVRLYLELLGENGDYLTTVQSRLARLLDGQGAPEIFATAIARSVALDPLNRSYRELQAWLGLERGDYEAALDAIRALDRLESEEGRALLQFAGRARAAGSPGIAAQALDEILRRHPTAPSAEGALFDRARLWDEAARDDHERTPGAAPQADSARAAYVRFLDRYPTSAAVPKASLYLAHLLRDVYRDFDGSEARLADAARGRDAGVAASARLALGDVALRRGDLDAARERYLDVDQSIRVGPLAEQARYELALLDFYEGFMFSALARAEALDENTAAEAANDAIALRVTLSESLDATVMPGPDVDLRQDPLHIYARAALRQRRGLDADALATLDSLDAALTPGSLLGDESLYLRASVLFDRGDAQEAVAVLDRLLVGFPMSYFSDRALRLQARAYERDLGDPASAAARYDRLLERFPGSPLAPEARSELRRLRADLAS